MSDSQAMVASSTLPAAAAKVLEVVTTLLELKTFQFILYDHINELCVMYLEAISMHQT